MNRDILTGSEAISAHYYTTMCIVQYPKLERAVEDNITCLLNNLEIKEFEHGKIKMGYRYLNIV